MNCLNCGDPLTGKYCSACGQKAVELNRPLRELSHEALEGLMAFDSRVLRTFWPLIRRPGLLTLEYLEGRRASYVPPLKLYFFVSFVLFLTLSMTKINLVHRGSSEESTNGVIVAFGGTDVPEADESESHARLKPDATEKNDDGIPDLAVEGEEEMATPEATASLGEGDNLFGIDLANALENESQLETNFVSRLAQVVFLLVPAFAALLKLVYWRSGKLYIQHLIFSLHVHTFAFLMLWLMSMLGMGPDWLSKPSGLLVPAILIYVLLAMKCVYGQGWPKTLLKSAFLWVLYLLLLLVAFLAAFLLAASMA